MDEKEYSNVYAIPANYTDSGKLLGGIERNRKKQKQMMSKLANESFVIFEKLQSIIISGK